ncbi:hypothetical protein LRC39_04000 [Rhodopseudomonas sp. P1]|uniref:hypothetical protein n=1 Tax=Rhodopseudomonas sp. P1 TaxID=3434357 RepID=UPI0031FC93C5
MNSLDLSHASHLRNALLALNPSGPDGFEGLLGIVLGAVTGQSFRLARSGSQRGRDGESAFDSGATYFEGKRYNDSPSKADIAAKLYDLEADDQGQVDLWILGATCEISAQAVSDLRNWTSRIGIGAFVLDWSDNDLGSLLVAILAADEDAKTFLRNNLDGTVNHHMVGPALLAIEHFKRHSHYHSRLTTLRDALSTESVGLGQAKVANYDWMSTALSGKERARARFGQPLAPLDQSNSSPTKARPLEHYLQTAFNGAPSSAIYAVIGEEGVGKSWLAVMSWLACSPRSLLLFCPADEFAQGEIKRDFEGWIIDLLIQQTSGQRRDAERNRWRRRLRGWRNNPAPTNVRLTLVVDGLNQILKIDWARWLDFAASELRALGGCLVMTTRSSHWGDLRNLLSSSFTPVTVVNWTEAELRDLLQGQNVDFSHIHNDVFQTLRNPRIFGIATDLLGRRDIESFDEISVGRLMFEHMRKAQGTGAANLSGRDFAEVLRSLADQMLKRKQADQTDDLRLFDASQQRNLEAISSLRFFSAIAGTASSYSIRDEGLTLALALWLIDALQREHRNHRSLVDRLEAILEPIAALDEAAQVVFLAVQAACLDDAVFLEVKSCLLEHFVFLQNLPQYEEAQFAALVRTAPQAFLIASEHSYTANKHVQNRNWLFHALLVNREELAVRDATSKALKRWLSYYSLAPERSMFMVHGREPTEQVAEERRKRQREIEAKIASLTSVERAFVSHNLIEYDYHHFDDLTLVSFYLLAGMPLAEFASALVRWSFSDALNSPANSPSKEFRQLVRFNQVDWQATRSALLSEIGALPSATSSSVAQWSRVEVLRSTGDLNDAREADDLAKWLTRDRPHFPGWSLLKTYCDVDPCDPVAVEPVNVGDTASKYRKINPSSLACHMGQGPEDHFFTMARAGVTRFHPSDALFVHRGLAADVLSRKGLARRQGVIALLEHSSVITQQQAQEFLSSGQSSVGKLDGSDGQRDEWLTGQYSLMLACPHHTPDQMLLAVPEIQSGPLLLDLLHSFRPASVTVVDSVLEQAFDRGDHVATANVLAALHYSGTTLSSRSCQIVLKLIQSPDRSVRVQALAIAASSDEPSLLEAAIKSNWRNSEDSFETWYGSSAILEAAKRHLIDADKTVEEIDITHLGYAVQTLGKEVAPTAVARIDGALRAALGRNLDRNLPEITTECLNSSVFGPPGISVRQRKPAGLRAQLDWAAESDSSYNERQKKLQIQAKQFFDELRAEDASLVLADLSDEGIIALVDADLDAAMRWLASLGSSNDIQLRHAHRFAVQLSVALARHGVGTANDMLQRLSRLSPIVARVNGIAKVPCDALTVWRSAASTSIAPVCKARLKSVFSDAGLALEIAAAISCGGTALVEEGVDELLAAGKPTDVCRALTISGFSDGSSHADAVLTQFVDASGFIGIARRSAQIAYERNEWSKHWYKRMKAAKTATEFWEASVLFVKIVDARFIIWRDSFGTGSDVFLACFPALLRKIENRIERWQDKRRDKLFGDDVPSRFILADWN